MLHDFCTFSWFINQFNEKSSALLNSRRDRGVLLLFLGLVFTSKYDDCSCFLVASMVSQDCFSVCSVSLVCDQFCFCFNHGCWILLLEVVLWVFSLILSIIAVHCTHIFLMLKHHCFPGISDLLGHDGIDFTILI